MLSKDERKHLLIFADKISNMSAMIPELEKKLADVLERRKGFDNLISSKSQKLISFGVLCLLALAFDYVVSNSTMAPLARYIGIKIFILALIFNVFDAIVAILASGVTAKRVIDTKNLKKIWRPVLWLLFIIKSSLFIAFALKGHSNVLEIILMLALAFLVYIILDFAGEGLYFIFGKIKYWFLMEIWNKKPDDVRKQIQRQCRKLSNEIKDFGYDEDEVYKELDVEKYCRGIK